MADNHNATTTGADILASKVSRALEVRTDTAAMKAALEALAHLPVIDSRSVRVAIEQDALVQALSMQEELQSLVDTVQELRQSVAATASIAHQASASVHSVSAATAETKNEAEHEEGEEEELASQLARAFEERDQARERAHAVDEFLNKFDLSQKESLLLDQYAFDDLETRGMHFLDALDRVRTIRHELSKTFGTGLDDNRSNKTEGSGDALKQSLGATSAIRMMESLASKQERAYERLYHWLQTHLNLQEQHQSQQQPKIDADAMDEALCLDFVKRSLYCLQMDVPAFYSHLVEMIATSRRSEETRRFLLALTSGYNGMPPIEVKAHDPVNYVGDMLAHVFCSYNTEADVARGLVEYKPLQDQESTYASKSDNDTTDALDVEKPMSAADILAHAMSGVSRPLKSRILQVISSLAKRPQHEGDEDEIDHADSMDEDVEQNVSRSRVSSLYSICGLLLFYHSAFSKAMDKLAANNENDEHDSPLVTAILECLEEGSQAYAASMCVHGATLESLAMISGDSEASLAHAMMTEITEVRMASPGFSADLPCPSGTSNIQASLSLEFLCETMVEAALSSCRSLDDAVTLKSCVHLAHKAGLKHDVTTKFNNLISDKEQVLIDALVESETKQVLELVGLGSLLVAWTRMEQVQIDGMTMASQPGLTPSEVETCVREFYASLYSPPIPSFDSVIKDPILRKRAQSQIATRVADVYNDLYHAMRSDKGGYDDLQFLGHTPSQVRTLFSV